MVTTLIGIIDLVTNTSDSLKTYNSLIRSEVHENTRILPAGHKHSVDINQNRGEEKPHLTLQVG